MEILNFFIEIGTLVAWLVSTAFWYRRVRGRAFGVLDLVIFGVLAVAADVTCVKLFEVVAGPRSESSAYGALMAILVLLGLVPVAAGLTLVAGLAALACLARYPGARSGALAVALSLVLVGACWRLGTADTMHEPGGVLNGDRPAGERWALESGAKSRAECDRQSRSPAFREGCYAWLSR